MNRRILIAGNWKMNKTPVETGDFIASFFPAIEGLSRVEVAIFPPYTSLDRAGRLLAETTVRLGGQDLHFEPFGAYTGAISAAMLVSCGCRYVLVGHSERRRLFGDDDRIVRMKLEAALSSGLSPILCVGETVEERRAGTSDSVVNGQLSAALERFDPERISIAYEPVWAIGTGETATPKIAQEMIGSIRRWIGFRFGESAADAVRILYGGSVTPDNAAAILEEADIDGVLVGGASLDPARFAAIVRAGESVVDRDV